MVIEEVNFMQNHLEIEKTCRESAEALATKLNKENKTLKRISMLYMAKLGPDVITEEINIDDDDPASDTDGAVETCVSVQCQKQIKELRDQIVSVQEEKKVLAIELENLKSKLVEVMEEVVIQKKYKEQDHEHVSLPSLASKTVNKVKQEKAVLNSEVLEQRKVLEKCNRVSMLAVEEYEELQVNLELEKDLRKKAESFAQEVKELEDQLENEALHKEIHNLRQQLELLEEDKRELEQKYQSSEEKARNLKHSDTGSCVVLLYCSCSHSLSKIVLEFHILLARKALCMYSRCLDIKGVNEPKMTSVCVLHTAEEVTDLKRQAVEEMMDRIKKGVHLRPVNQTARPKTKPDSLKGSESAVDELKGILGTLNKSTSSRSLKSLGPENSETELERILRRRKVTAEADSSSKQL
ncbi:hypothetical protein A6R68_06233 [Neotoma lepida]|uniref:Shootin-1 n=1 Tax=Neotoma lepida TaxID=56216 RepID=A0A1A6GG51_NEOLE|nr:hypothetical protein A6R68_06233 [Neotoma lepida]